MDAEFWHDKWKKKEIAFHGSSAHPLLTRYFGALGIAPGGRVFLPLCGKTLDLAWLMSQGYRVAGAELSELAIRELFEELHLTPRVEATGSLKRYSAAGIDIFTGDFFDLTADALGKVDAVYDRAALVALPPAMRVKYASHLASVSGQAPQLLISFEYDQSRMPGPPFSVDAAEIRGYYGAAFEVQRAAGVEIPGGLKGQVRATEVVWLLTRTSSGTTPQSS